MGSFYRAVCLAFMFTTGSAIAAADDLPETTHDGLVLQHGTEMSAVYKRPDAVS